MGLTHSLAAVTHMMNVATSSAITSSSAGDGPAASEASTASGACAVDLGGGGASGAYPVIVATCSGSAATIMPS